MDLHTEKYKEQLPIILIMLAAFAGRFRHFTEIPFVHDELSALFRTRFNSFSELIAKGVMPDGHPAGIQVFLWYWGKIAGFSETALKIPFLVMGTASVWFIYLLGKKWFGKTTGLIAAAAAAVMQYTIFYSQIARPYSSGLFFSLLMVYFWSALVFEPQKNFLTNAVFYVLSSSLCAYNHHFSLLFAAIVGFSGLFFIQKAYIKKYILCGLAIFVLYLPHTGIFIHQLKAGGVEAWLGKPGNDFLLQYIYFVFNYSTGFIAIAALLFLCGFFSKNRKKISPQYILSLVWFLLPFLIGFFYSKYVNSVLQYSVLIFSFPFLLYFLFGRLPELPFRKNLLLVLIILTTGSYSLIYGRRHYRLFYQSAYENILLDHQQTENREGKNLVSIIHSNDAISKYYIEKEHLDSCFLRDTQFKIPAELSAWLKDSSASSGFLFYGAMNGADPVNAAIIRDYFPNIISHKKYAGGESFLFSKSGEPSGETHLLTENGFENEKTNWTSANPANLADTASFSGRKSFLMNKDTEWSPVFCMPTDSLALQKYDIIEVSLKTKKLSDTIDALVVVSVENNGKPLIWNGSPFYKFIPSENAEKNWNTIFNATEIYLTKNKLRNSQLKVYIWNKGKNRFLIDDIRISIRKGNPVKYGLSEKI